MSRKSYIEQTTVINRSFEPKYFNAVRRALKTKVDEVAGEIKDNGFHSAMQHLHKNIGNVALSTVIKKLYSEIGVRHARRVFGMLKEEKSFISDMEVKRLGYNAIWVKFIQDYLVRFLLEKITYEVNTTTRDKLLSVLQEAIDKGWGVDETVNHMEDFVGFQAARIVRTEINRAANVGVIAGGESFPFQQKKEWMAVHDKRTRGNPVTGLKDHANHWSLDRTTIDFEDVFIDPRNGDHLMHPGDPKASAASTINCRCILGLSAKRDANDNLIPKRKTTVVIYPHRVQRQTVLI